MLRRAAAAASLQRASASSTTTRSFSHSKPSSREKARVLASKPEPVAKVFSPASASSASLQRGTTTPAELSKARLELAKQKTTAAAPSPHLLAFANQELARLTARELVDTLYSVLQFAGSLDTTLQRLEVVREIFGRHPGEFAADELVEVLQLLRDEANDRPVQNVRHAFAEELAKRSAKSFSTSALVFLLPNASTSKFSKLAAELAKREDFSSPSELAQAVKANAGQHAGLALHLTSLLTSVAGLDFDALLHLRFTQPSAFSQSVWAELSPQLAGGGEEGKEYTAQQVRALVSLLPFGSKAMDHDLVAKLVTGDFLKCHANLASALHALAEVEYNTDSAVWQRVLDELQQQPALFLPSVHDQAKLLGSVGKFAPQPVVDAVVAKSLFANNNGGEVSALPWKQPADLAQLSVDELTQVQSALAKSKSPALSAVQAELKQRA